jgi:hypothetical protein
MYIHTLYIYTHMNIIYSSIHDSTSSYLRLKMCKFELLMATDYDVNPVILGAHVGIDHSEFVQFSAGYPMYMGCLLCIYLRIGLSVTPFIWW